MRLSGVYGGQKMASDTLELVLKMVVKAVIWVLKIKAKSFSPDPYTYYFWKLFFQLVLLYTYFAIIQPFSKKKNLHFATRC